MDFSPQPNVTARNETGDHARTDHDIATLRITEIFHSIQGEGTRAGRPCVFVRLTGCHLRCSYCDTEYAFHQGTRWSLGDIVEQVIRFGSPLVQITGGEPLLQPGVHPLMTMLCDRGLEVTLETSGACDISTCDDRVIRIMDLKTPGSGEPQRNRWANLKHLTCRDELKFVITDRADFDWAMQVIHEHDLGSIGCAILLSPAHAMPVGRELPGSPGLEPGTLAQWMLQANAASEQAENRPQAGAPLADDQIDAAKRSSSGSGAAADAQARAEVTSLAGALPGALPRVSAAADAQARAEVNPLAGALAGALPGAGAGLPSSVRLQMQLHKLIWHPLARGV